jgi:single-stranded-DNA-specific exonuclease
MDSMFFEEQAVLFRWRLAQRAPMELFDAGRGAGLNPAIIQSLYARGYTDLNAIQGFISTNGHEPPNNGGHLLKDMDRAVDRVEQALLSGERIGVHTDYDVDGVISAVILTLVLRYLGAEPVVYLPNRFADGYGLSVASIDRFHAQGVGLVITGDCGILNYDAVDYATKLGIDVVITDHHLPSSRLPNAKAVVNPNRADCLYSYKFICGAGVVLKLMEQLLRRLHRDGDGILGSVSDLIALATIADVSNLADPQNRYWVNSGLHLLNSSPRPGLAALLEKSGVSIGDVDVEAMAFRLIPRLNAPGRLADPNAAYNLLLEEDWDRALALAVELDRLNSTRQELLLDMISVADEQVRTQMEWNKSLVLIGEEWPVGMLGPLVSRMVDQYHRPSLVISHYGGLCIGSGRSPRGIPIMDLMRDTGVHFLSLGGHASACGFRLHMSEVSLLQERFEALCQERLSDDDLVSSVVVDGALPLHGIDLHTALAVQSIGPFGEGFPKPVYMVRRLRLLESQVVKDRHWRVVVGRTGEEHRYIRGIAFNMASLRAQVPVGAYMDVICHLIPKSWMGERWVELQILDFKLP